MLLDKKLTNEEKLDHVYQMTLENHEILKSIRRQQYVGNALRILYWLVILGAIGGMYYYLRPFISFLGENSDKLGESLNYLNQMKDQLPEARLINQVLEGMRQQNPAQ
jgi:hypothetical protein